MSWTTLPTLHTPIPGTHPSPHALSATFFSQHVLLCVLTFIVCYYNVYFSLVSLAQENINIMKVGQYLFCLPPSLWHLSTVASLQFLNVCGMDGRVGE